MHQSIASFSLPSNQAAMEWHKLKAYRFTEDIKHLELFALDSHKNAVSHPAEPSTDVNYPISYSQFMQDVVKKKPISTTIHKLDIHPAFQGLCNGTITEFVGYPEVKTHLCYKITVDLLLKNSNAHVVYITTAGTYSSEAVKDLIEPFTEDYEPILKHIHVADVTTLEDLMIVVNSLTLNDEDFNMNMVELLVVDSIFTCFKDTRNLNLKVSHIHAVTEFVRSLKQLGGVYKFPLVFTNSLTVKDEAKTEPKCYLGEHYTEFVNTRVLMYKTGDISVILPPIGKV